MSMDLRGLFGDKTLSHDPIHGYIAFTAAAEDPAKEVAERQLIDHPWVQRLRQIHQLQCAWWVFPAAQHTRFQHVLGAMHLASRAAAQLYPSLKAVCPDCPSRGYVESLLRIAALLHDVGHGPFGHFLDQYLLRDYGLTHETLGAEIIRREFAPLIRRIRRNPFSALEPDEILDPEQVAFLIVRPKAAEQPEQPRWLIFLRSLFCGIYTLDNMDFVLRDAYMTGYNIRAFDLERLLQYTVFSEKGLTIHERGLSALVRFVAVRAELFHSVYYHRTVRAIDLTLRDLFLESKPYLFPGNPLDHLEEYRQFTDWALFTDVSRWARHPSDSRLRQLGEKWQGFLRREVPWKLACERTIVFGAGHSEEASVFSDEKLFEEAFRRRLPRDLRDLPLRFDPARHVYRPGSFAPTAGQNFLFDAATGEVRPLEDRDLFRHIPLSYRICRVYTQNLEYKELLARVLDSMIRGGTSDELTNV
ncbi:MAG: HD domain-containing protein [Thermoguttaceae bacterium]|nr:HD domain-containing protein [Thermoguttaceae bacterium]MDW8077980.1 HD domain-containing protein [Thermoguttaceae bacterium]